MLGSSLDEATSRRAKRMSDDATDGYSNEVNRRKKEIRGLESRLDAMMDISASPDRNLDNRAVDFDGDKFISEMSSLIVNIEVKTAELKIVEEKVGAYFKENE